MASRDEAALGPRLVIGAIAGVVATIAFTSTVERLQTRKERSLAPRRPSTFELAAPFAFGALCGAILAAVDSRPGRVSGTLAGGGLWLASEMGWLPDVVVRPARGRPSRRSVALLAAHVAWGWTAAETIEQLTAE